MPGASHGPLSSHGLLSRDFNPMDHPLVPVACIPRGWSWELLGMSRDLLRAPVRVHGRAHGSSWAVQRPQAGHSEPVVTPST